MRAPKPLSHLGLLSLLSALLYLPTLTYPLVFDDHVYLKNNPFFKDLSFFARLFTDFSGIVHQAVKLGYDGDVSANFVLRPLTYLTFWLNHTLGGMAPEGYRLVNTCIHLGVAFLVFDLARSVSPQIGFAERGNSLKTLFPSVASILFLVHPLQIESVTYLTQRATSLNAFFYLLTLVCHRRAFLSGESRLWNTGTSVFCVSAMLTKESGITLPFAAVLLDWCVFSVPLRKALCRARVLLLLAPLIPLLVASVAAIQRGGLTIDHIFNIGHGERQSGYGAQYLLTQPWVWFQYLRLFLWPTGLNADPDVPWVTQVSDSRFWGPVAVPILLGFAMFWSGRKHPSFQKQSAPLVCGVAWFALTLSPSSVLPLPDAMAEHRVYLSLAGLCIGLSASFLLCLEHLITRPLHVRWTLWFLLGIGCALGLATQQRNQVWSSEVSFWGDVCRRNPTKVRPWLNYGSALAEAGRFPEAEVAYSTAIKLQPSGLAYANLALAQLRSSQPQKALETALNCLKCSSSGYDFFVLGVVGECFVRENRLRESIPYIEGSLRASPGYLTSIKLLGMVFLSLQDGPRAREAFLRGLSFHPGNAELQKGLRHAELLLQAASPAPTLPPSTAAPPEATFKLQLGLSP